MPYRLSEVTPEVIESIKAQHPNTELRQIEAEGLEHLLVIRPPTKFEYKRFRDLAQKGKDDKAQETLISDCLVYPPQDEYEELLETLPGIGEVIIKMIVHLAGIYEKAEAKKF